MMRLKIGLWGDFFKLSPPNSTYKYAMPWVSDTGNDFGLASENSNRKKLTLYLQNLTEVLEEDAKYKFFLSGSWTEGGYLIKYNKSENLIVYYCKFQIIPSSSLFSHIASQVEVWRAVDQPAGMAKKVFFNTLYPKYKAIMSANIHTERGKEFWQIILATADSLNLSIAFIFKDQIFTKPEEMSLTEFYKNLGTWNKDKENKEIRFLIFDPKLLAEQCD